MNNPLNSLKPVFSSYKLLVPLTLVIALTLYFTIGKANHKSSDRINPAFASYISAYTSGAISKTATIRVQFVGNFGDSAKIGNEAHVFDFEPHIEGKTTWIDATTIEFKPDKPLPSGKKYEAVFKLGKIIEVASELKVFNFSFQVIAQSFEVTQPTFESIDNQQLIYQRITGSIITADVETDDRIEQLLSATYLTKPCKISWQHAADQRTHRYLIDSIERKSVATALSLKWDGSILDIDNKGEHVLNIPALGDFKVLTVTVQNDGEQYIALQFSDPILANQDLTGLITIDDQLKTQQTIPVNNQIELRFTINNNEVKCYPGTHLTGAHSIFVHQGIKNSLNYPLPESIQQELDFAPMLPAVSMVGKGVIMPTGNQIIVPFEAISLKAVDVTITKIYENNVAQFLQVNQLGESNELKRVGRPILRKTIRLDEDKLLNLNKSNRFAVQLDKLIKTEPGAIYHVKLSFKKEYAVYKCDGQEQENLDDGMRSTEEENWDSNDEPRQSSFWDYSEDYYSEDYSWNERDNPCHNSYYNPSRWISKNILASNLGLIAKKGTGGDFFVSVTDIKTTQPLSGVSVQLLDFQQQLITSVITNNDGWARFTPKNKPYLLVAKLGNQRGYLRVDDGSSLSLSRFDVSGDVVQKGIKGFIYGERGIWRPGDSLYLTFILEDKTKALPPSHPVSFELFNPQGILYKRVVQSQSINNFYSFHTATNDDAPTGNWLVKVKVGSAEFQKNIKIETVMPNRLKIGIDFNTSLLQAGSQLNSKLTSKWLHGATADGLDATIEASLTPMPTTFAKYNEFVFDDPTRKFNANPEVIFEGKLDNNGNAQITTSLTPKNTSAGMLKANFVTKVFEPGGNFSIDRFSLPFSPYKSYVGIRLPKGDKERGMLLTDTNHLVQIAAVSPTGAPVQGVKKVKAILYQISWRWWWDKSDEDLSNFSSTENYRQLQEETVTLVNGKGNWKLRVNYPEWGRYLLRVIDEEGGHSTGKIMYIDWPGWAGRAQKNNPQESTMLTFNTDKSTYAVGESVTLFIPSGTYQGRALVSIESGTKVIASYWTETQKSQTKFSFKVTPNMLPNVYVHVTLLQPHNQTVNDLPIRMYGMVPIMVEDKQTVLTPQFSLPSQLKPEEPFEVKVSEATGKPMTYTLAIVDEGLLDLTRFKTPNPHPHFYAREALGVKTWDMFDDVIGAFGMPMNRILSIGGDEGINRKSQNTKANRFKPVVKFIGPFTLEKGVTKTHKIVLPQYVGSVRVMVVAGDNGAYGFAEKAVPVKKPLMILATLPRVLGPGELLKLPVTVFALEKNIKNVTIQVLPNQLVQISGNASKNILFKKPGDEVVDFELKVRSSLGIAKLKILATSGAEKAICEVELDVRNPNPFVSKVYESTVNKSNSWNVKYTPEGMKGTNTAILEVSSIPPINLNKRLDYLIHYPYGCIEQTTSSVFPQLALNMLLDLAPKQRLAVEKNIKVGIQRLRNFQTADGGLAYWPGQGNAEEWGTNYAGHFMVEAQNFGYSLPVGFLSNWKKFQKNKALSWTSYTPGSSDFIQAYRLYTLALAKAPELGAMNRLKELGPKLSNQAKWRLAAAYVLVGQKEIAEQLVNNLPTLVKDYQELGLTFGSDERDAAMIMETLVLLENSAKANLLLTQLSKKLASEEWMSTQTTAYSLIAIAKLSGILSGYKGMHFSYTVQGKQQTIQSTKRISQTPIEITGNQSGMLNLTNKGEQKLYARIILKGQPEIGKSIDEERNLNMIVSYKDMQNNEIDPTRIVQGTDFKMEVTISNPGLMGNYYQMALSQIFPSGWEIHNTRLDNPNGEQSYSSPTYQDLRDDRVYTYFDLGTKQKVTFVVLLNASYLGRYYMPMVSCEAMYNNRIAASKGGKWVEVVPKKQVPRIVASK